MSTFFSGTCVTTRKPNSTSRTPLGAEPVWCLDATPLRLIIAVRLATRNFGREQRSNGAKAATQSSNLNAAYSRLAANDPFWKARSYFQQLIGLWRGVRCSRLCPTLHTRLPVMQDLCVSGLGSAQEILSSGGDTTSHANGKSRIWIFWTQTCPEDWNLSAENLNKFLIKCQKATDSSEKTVSFRFDAYLLVKGVNTVFSRPEQCASMLLTTP